MEWVWACFFSFIFFPPFGLTPLLTFCQQGQCNFVNKVSAILSTRSVQYWLNS